MAPSLSRSLPGNVKCVSTDSHKANSANSSASGSRQLGFGRGGRKRGLLVHHFHNLSFIPTQSKLYIDSKRWRLNPIGELQMMVDCSSCDVTAVSFVLEHDCQLMSRWNNFDHSHLVSSHHLQATGKNALPSLPLHHRRKNHCLRLDQRSRHPHFLLDRSSFFRRSLSEQAFSFSFSSFYWWKIRFQLLG